MGSFSLEEWLEQIDPSMKEYANQLEKFGFGSLKTLQVNYVKRSSFDLVTHLEFSSLALQI